MDKIILKPHLVRECEFYTLDSKDVPRELFDFKPEKPDLSGFRYPLPSAKSDYLCYVMQGNVIWLGAKTGLTRYNPDAEYRFDKVMYFSADRDLEDNYVKALYPHENGVWVLTEKAVTKISMVVMSCEEIDNLHTEETLKYVVRQGMVSQRYLAEPRILDTALPYAVSDNDGGFTANFCMGQIFKYVVCKKEKGINHPETVTAKKNALKALDACMLLMYIHGRGDGFVARTYIFDGEPVPDDGFFFKRNGDTSICIYNETADNAGKVGAESYCGAPIPERLKYLYEDKGKTLDDIIYKADTSSDEITLQMLNLLFAHKYLVVDDPDLDSFIKESAKNIVKHIIDNGFVLKDYHGGPTTWAKWNEDYFNSEEGYVDSALNSAEMLFLLKAVMEISGEKGEWLNTYNYLIKEKGYADLTEKHFDRMYQMSLADKIDFQSDIMYGDHFLATCAFYGLCTLEKDEKLLLKYRKGFKAWRSSIAPEHNPGYDFLYLLACPDDSIDSERVVEWFCRHNSSRLAASVSVIGRHDVVKVPLKNNYIQMSSLLPPDERFISKYDRNTVEYKNVDCGGILCIESSYVYSFAYWIGRYFGFII